MHKKRIYFSYLDTCIEILEDPSFLSNFFEHTPLFGDGIYKDPP